MIDFSAMTNEEYYRLNGNLSEERIEKLLELEAEHPDLDDIRACAYEAKAQYPEEDFLSDIQDRLAKLHKNVRGSNKEELAGIMEALSDLAQTTFYATESGLDDLNTIITEIDKIV